MLVHAKLCKVGQFGADAYTTTEKSLQITDMDHIKWMDSMQTIKPPNTLSVFYYCFLLIPHDDPITGCFMALGFGQDKSG